MIRGDVRFHQDADQHAVSTTAESERDFIDGAAVALKQLGCKDEGELARWLGLIVDVACKLRGYKADVVEKRQIIAGNWLPSDSVAVVAGTTVERDITTA